MTASERPGFLRMIRAPFLSSILAPLIAGSLLAAIIKGSLDIPGFVLVLVMGIGLHIATNVYNDIYDTLQGTDRVNVHRNEFSGGSGVLQEHPDLMPVMLRTARIALVVAALATAGLTAVIDRSLWPHLWALYLLSAFFSKYYTAAPPKLAYRGWGEISVWFAFGPMAILVAAVSQGVGFHPTVLIAMPMTGISTLSILLIGQLIDLDADRQGGKLGVAARLGTGFTAGLYLTVQILLVIDVLLLAFVFVERGWPLSVPAAGYLEDPAAGPRRSGSAEAGGWRERTTPPALLHRPDRRVADPSASPGVLRSSPLTCPNYPRWRPSAASWKPVRRVAVRRR
ncbi:prenyltransferase [Gemmatimonadota bacterium]